MQVLFVGKITTVSWRKKEEMRQNTVGSFLGMQRFKVNVSTKTFFYTFLFRATIAFTFMLQSLFLFYIEFLVVIIFFHDSSSINFHDSSSVRGILDIN